MTNPNSERKYFAPRRLEQAAATRTAIIDAATRMFVERGYAGATINAIAAEARVAPKSVYALADKPTLLMLALDRAIAGDDAPVAMADRPEFRAIVDASDPREQVEHLAATATTVLLRLYPLYRAFEQATATEPALKASWEDFQQRRRTDVARIVHAMSAVSPLRSGLTEQRAVDTLWALLTWHPVALLVDQRGWTSDELEDWLRDVLSALLLPPPVA